MSEPPPLWTPEEARAEAEREGEAEVPPLRGCLADLPFEGFRCALEGCVALATPCLLLLGGAMFVMLRNGGL